MSLVERLSESLKRNDFILLVLSRPLSPSASSHKVTVRPVDLKDGRHYQWVTRAGSQERHENLAVDEFLERAGQAFGTAFGDVHLYTSHADVTARAQRNGQVKWKTKPPTKAAVVVAAHDREKNYLIPAGKPCPFLAEIGVMTPSGQVRASMSAKFRQINRYLEFIDDILPVLPTDRPIRVVDFGCGKSYLTFALHHFLTAIHRRTVQITGLDLKDDVIAHCTDVAARLRCVGLEFRSGAIADYRPAGPVDAAISLHACDTATDDAIAAAITWNCRAIFAVPCCQREIHRLLRPDSVPGLTDYGLFRDRFAALATDALRAQFLEAAGYKTQVLEFIDLEHTPKNILIRALRRDEPDDSARIVAREKLAKLKSLLGITTWRLEEALAERCLVVPAS
jgi:SAM-dependent methyltransferase